MFCHDCGEKAGSWQEYCKRCGADLAKREKQNASTEHTLIERLYCRQIRN